MNLRSIFFGKHSLFVDNILRFLNKFVLYWVTYLQRIKGGTWSYKNGMK